MKQTVYIHWFTADLRLADNPALTFAAKRAARDNIPLLTIYIHDTNNNQIGEASKRWLHHSLQALNKQLGGMLHVYKGDVGEVFKNSLMQHFIIKGVFRNKSHKDEDTETTLEAAGLAVQTFNDAFLWKAEDLPKPYKVFTPYYKKARLFPIQKPLPKPKTMKLYWENAAPLMVSDLSLNPKTGWEEGVLSHWQVGEKAAHKRLDDFIENGLRGYKEGRDYPARNNVSRLSPHLHFGEISPRQIWHAIEKLGDDTNPDLESFRRQLAWREFSYSLLYNNPDLPTKNIQSKFDNFPWQENKEHLRSWQTGQTGYPIIDAGMRELYQTGYMHNRVRMLVGSFLVKNLMLHWHHGFDWFWDCLVDADLANNAASWQWIAGCGADAAPFFRILNPITQSKKFDPDGIYIKTYIPELKHLSPKEIHEPWAHTQDYPKPIVDLKTSRDRALVAFKGLKRN